MSLCGCYNAIEMQTQLSAGYVRNHARVLLVQVALIATCIVVCLDTRYRPARIKPEWKEKLMLGRSLESSSPKSNGAHAPSKEAVKAVA